MMLAPTILKTNITARARPIEPGTAAPVVSGQGKQNGAGTKEVDDQCATRELECGKDIFFCVSQFAFIPPEIWSGPSGQRRWTAGCR